MTSIRPLCVVGLAMLLSQLARGEDFSLRGRKALEKEDYDKAISAFTKAIEVNPKDMGRLNGGIGSSPIAMKPSASIPRCPPRTTIEESPT